MMSTKYFDVPYGAVPIVDTIVKSPILSKKGKMLQEKYQMKLLKLVRNEAKQRMYKSRSNIVINLNVLK